MGTVRGGIVAQSEPFHGSSNPVLSTAGETG
jgi:hypothetical protein